MFETTQTEKSITLNLLYHQGKFIDSVIGPVCLDGKRDIENSYRYSCLATGLGAGKTFSGGFLVEYLTNVFRCPGVIIAPTFTLLEDSTLEGAKAEWDYVGAKYQYSVSAKNLIINNVNVFLRSLKYPETIKGLPPVGWIWIDEASLGSFYKGFRFALGRLRKSIEKKMIHMEKWPMKFFVTTTPNGKDYVYDFFIGDVLGKSEFAKKRFIISEIDSEENIFLDEDYIESLNSDYTGNFKLQEKGGKFVQMEGAVWEPYISTPLFVEENGIKQFPSGIDLSFDFGYRRPAVGFFTKLYDPQQKKVINFLFDTILIGNILIEDLLVKVKERLNEWGYKKDPIVITCDAAGDAANDREYFTEIDRVQRAFPDSNVLFSRQIEFRSVAKGIVAVERFFKNRQLAIASYLNKKKTPDEYNDAITAMSQTRYPEVRPGVPLRNVYVKGDGNDDVADMVRYWAVFQER